MKKLTYEAECVCNEDGSCTIKLQSADEHACCNMLSVTVRCESGGCGDKDCC